MIDEIKPIESGSEVLQIKDDGHANYDGMSNSFLHLNV